MQTDLEGVSIGHWTNETGDSGCTVVLLPEGTVASGEVRGGAPATREFALLDPVRMMQQVDAVVLSGGSAFGLAAGDGVMRALAESGRGYPTAGGVVPIVVGMCIYDLRVAIGARPDADSGRVALANAGRIDEAVAGRIGAGAGATYRKWWGPDGTRPGGLGVASLGSDELIVTAIVVVNAVGDIDPGDGTFVGPPPPRVVVDADRENTTIGVIVTNAVLDKRDCLLVAQGGHDGLARAIVPAHTSGDGDALVAAATGRVTADPGYVRALATEAVAQAVRSILAIG